MAQLPKFDPIDYLLARRYPSWKISPPSTYSLAQMEYVKAQKEVRAHALAYEQELRAKTPEEIAQLVEAERATEAEQLRRRQEAKENSHFYNQPTARADFTHWGKLSYWTLDEAVALSFGRAPESVNWKTIEPYAPVSPFALQYKRRLDLAVRAKNSSELYDPVKPGFVIAWARRLELNFPEELEAIVVAMGGHIGDWRAAYENEAAAHRKTMGWAKGQIDEAMATAKRHQTEAFEIGRKAVAERDAEIARLHEALRVAETNLPSGGKQKLRPAAQDLGPRERESMLRLIIGMAIRGYTYDPTATKNKAVKEIADDLQTLGVGLDEDTIRKYLQEAKDILPR